MVAITVVLTGVIYMWLSNLSAGGDENLAYVGHDITKKNGDWEVTILSVKGNNLAIDDLKFLIYSKDKVLIHSKSTLDSNPQALLSGESKVYPLASNSTGVVIKGTSQPVIANTSLDNYVGAMFTVIDYDSNDYLTEGDTIRIYSDFDGDGIEDIDHTYNFAIKDSSLKSSYVWAQF
jgi:hypothetical protein